MIAKSNSPIKLGISAIVSVNVKLFFISTVEQPFSVDFICILK